MKLLKLFQKNTTNIFETVRTEENLYEIVNDFRILLHLSENVKIRIKWGRKAKRVLGSVKFVNGVSVITISKYLSDYNLPDFVLQEVILHEMIHIKTGYGSELDKEYKHAHRGGVIRKEMALVGKEDLFDISDKWIKKSWYYHVRSYNMRENKKLKQKAGR